MNARLRPIPVRLPTLITVFFSLLIVSSSPAAEIDCLQCHDQLKKGKYVHQALDMGCATCHTGIDASTIPHKNKSKLAHGLSSEQPALCYGCHDKAEFSKKDIHPPVASGGCTACHSPHSSDEIALLSQKPIDLCLQCHPNAPHGQHISSRPTASGKQGTEPQDPMRPGKPFYCGSCHNPHSTDSPLLFRFNARSVTDLCTKCHKM